VSRAVYLEASVSPFFGFFSMGAVQYVSRAVY